MTIQPNYQSLKVLSKVAKQISKDKQIPHNRALDLAALNSGFQSYRRAKVFFSTHERITAYCRYSDRDTNEKGIFEQCIYLSKAEIEFLGPNFKHNFYYEAKERGKHIYKVYWASALSKKEAMNYVFQFLRKIQFSVLTSTIPHNSDWMNGRSRKAIDRFNKAPWSDHDCSWKDKTTGGVIYIQQPYPGKYRLEGLSERQEWAEQNHFSYYEFDWALYGHGTYMIGLSPKRNPLQMDEINNLARKGGKPIGMVKITDDRFDVPYQNDY